MLETHRRLRDRTMVFFTVLNLILFIGTVAKVDDWIDDLQTQFDVRCQDQKDARQWQTEVDALVFYVIDTRRSDDPELVERVGKLQDRIPTDFEPIVCP